jgi:hypothetical protein
MIATVNSHKKILDILWLIIAVTDLCEIQLTLHWAQIIVEKVNIVVVTAWFHLHIAAIAMQQQLMVQVDGWKCTHFPILSSVKTFDLTKLHLIFLMSFAGGFTDSEEYKLTCSGHKANDFYGE